MSQVGTISDGAVDSRITFKPHSTLDARFVTGFLGFESFLVAAMVLVLVFHLDAEVAFALFWTVWMVLLFSKYLLDRASARQAAAIAGETRLVFWGLPRDHNAVCRALGDIQLPYVTRARGLSLLPSPLRAVLVCLYGTGFLALLLLGFSPTIFFGVPAGVLLFVKMATYVLKPVRIYVTPNAIEFRSVGARTSEKTTRTIPLSGRVTIAALNWELQIVPDVSTQKPQFVPLWGIEDRHTFIAAVYKAIERYNHNSQRLQDDADGLTKASGGSSEENPAV